MKNKSTKRILKQVNELSEPISLLGIPFHLQVTESPQEMKMRKWILGLIFLIIRVKHRYVAGLEIGLSSDFMARQVTGMYVLGDSSVDCGDNTPFYGFIHHNLSLFPCNGSDSTLLPQILAMKMGLPNTTPFFSHNGSIHEILRGVNFGSAEATIIHHNSYQSLNQQLRQASETIQLLQLHLGQDAANDFIESSIFYISFGKDDFIDYFANNSSSLSGFNYTGQSFSHVLVHQLTNAVRDLYDTYARKIVVAGVLPLGCAPRVLLRFGNNSSDSVGCVDEVNGLVSEFNTRIEENVLALNAELHGSHIVFCDVYRAVMNLINNPKAYGIEDVKNACCGVGRYGGVSGCSSKEMACGEASRHVWWDLYNPTAAVNSLLAESAWSGHPLPSICRPITVQQLLSSSSV